MKLGALHFLVGVIALVVGIAVGGLGPRAEVHALRAQLEEAGECKTEGTMGTEIANVFRGRPWDEDGPQRKVTRFDTEPEPAAPTPTEPPAPPAEDGAIQITLGDDGEQELDPAEVEQTLDMAREAMELRYAQARAALIEDAKPTDAQLEKIDSSVRRMNDELLGLANDLVDQVKQEGEPNRRDTMLFAAETLDVVLSAEDELRGVLDAEQIAALQDESLDPLSYVDPAIVDVLGQLNGLGNPQ